MAIKEQLKLGIRYIDCRVYSDIKTGEFHFFHGLGSKIPAFEPLQDVKSFLTLHPKEIIILDFTQGNKNVYLNIDVLSNDLIRLFGPMVVPYRKGGHLPSMMDIWKQGKQVILIIDTEFFREQFWPKSIIVSYWKNTANTTLLYNFLTKGIRERPKNDMFYVSQGILNVNLRVLLNIRFFLTGRLETDLAPLAASTVKSWIYKMETGTENINICIIDFVQMQNFTGSIIDANYN